jgi:MFS family permease
MPKKIIKTYVTLSFLLSLSHAFFFATYQVFLFSRGMDFLQMNIINMFFMISVFLFEVPTGAFADVLGRKKSVVAGCFVLSLSFLVYFVSHSFWIFVLAEIIGALGIALISGALEAWAVDSLKYHGYDGNLEHVFKRESQFDQAGILVGSVVGGYIGNINIAYPWLACSIGCFLVGIYALAVLKEKYFEKKRMVWSVRPIVQVAKDSVYYGIKHKAVFFLVSFVIIWSFTLQGFNMQWPFVFKNNYGFSVAGLGWLFAATSLVIMLGSQLSTWFSRRIKHEKNAMILSQGVTALAMILASAMFGFVPVLIGFMGHELGRGLFRPLKSAYLNRRIPDEKRATVISFESMVGKLGSFLGLLVSGYLAKKYSISLSWLVSGVVLALSVIVFLKLKNGE